jgi:hypothetical protein
MELDPITHRQASIHRHGIELDAACEFAVDDVVRYALEARRSRWRGVLHRRVTASPPRRATAPRIPRPAIADR